MVGIRGKSKGNGTYYLLLWVGSPPEKQEKLLRGNGAPGSRIWEERGH